MRVRVSLVELNGFQCCLGSLSQIGSAIAAPTVGKERSTDAAEPKMRFRQLVGADSEEKHEPASDIDTALMDSLKVLDLERPIREADIPDSGCDVRKVPSTEVHMRKPHHPASAPCPTLVPLQATIRSSRGSWRSRFH